MRMLFCAEEQMTNARKYKRRVESDEESESYLTLQGLKEAGIVANYVVVECSWMNNTGGTLDGCSLDRIVR